MGACARGFKKGRGVRSLEVRLVGKGALVMIKEAFVWDLLELVAWSF
jgi:hypothetical protein